jgi:HAMP domain-containing protein
VLLATAVGWLVSGRITAPLHALAATTQRMAAGDLAARATVEGRDEPGRLARSFNEMAGQIEATIVALRRFVAPRRLCVGRKHRPRRAFLSALAPGLTLRNLQSISGV